MTKQHPITPPPELVQQWLNEPDGIFANPLATQAARWGADQELEACCKWLECNYNYPQANPLRIARRPKPPTLKEQALTALDDAIMRGDCITISDALPTLRRALEALPE